MDEILSILSILLLLVPVFLFIYRCPNASYWPALCKAFFLWLISTSPIFLSILLGVPTDDSDGGNVFYQVLMRFKESFPLSEAYVYTAAFIAPILYVVFDLYRNLHSRDLIFDNKSIKKHLRGMQWIFLSSSIILFLTVISYSASKADPDGFSKTILYKLLVERGFYLYAASLVIWYSVILWETPSPVNFEETEKEESNDFAAKYAARRSGNG